MRANAEKSPEPTFLVSRDEQRDERGRAALTRYRVSVDIGGTFTDLVVYDERERRAFTGKVLSTPDDPACGVITGLTGLVEEPGEISFLVHGTTVGLNAFLERRGERVLLITTEGFGDVYSIARGDRKQLFALQYRKPEPLIPPWDVHTVRERMLYDGTVEDAIHRGGLRPDSREDRARGHRLRRRLPPARLRRPGARAARARARPRGGPRPRRLVCSHEVAPEWREYERWSSTRSPRT